MSVTLLKRYTLNLKPIFDEEFLKFDWDPFGFLIRKHHKLGQVPTLAGRKKKGGTGLVRAECRSQWDRFGIGTWYRHAACTKPVPGKGRKRPVPCPRDR